MDLTRLTGLFAQAGCNKLYAKHLSENDNSKNQIYFAGTVESLNIFPYHQIYAENTKRGPSFKAHLDFGWLLENGQVDRALGAQLILYSQYPEVRFSGFLDGCKTAPSELMRSRLAGRILFLGVATDRRVLGFVVSDQTQIAREFNDNNYQPSIGVFIELALPGVIGTLDSRIRLLNELHRINRLGWINSKQLDASGQLKPCRAPQCGGYTLEAELGIPKNSDAEPDYFGWEVKQHKVSKFNRPATGTPITIMTPEPTGGFYHDHGPEDFIRKFGYPDKLGRADRLNFGGIHKVGNKHPLTGLTMQLNGFNIATGKITDANGAVVLVDDGGIIGASWAFTGLLAHWSRKHMHAVYVPSMFRLSSISKSGAQNNRRDVRGSLEVRKDTMCPQYSYGDKVRLAQGTDSIRLLIAFANGMVYYDPGIKLEQASTKPVVKRRSQFRIASKHVGALYASMEVVEV